MDCGDGRKTNQGALSDVKRFSINSQIKCIKVVLNFIHVARELSKRIRRLECFGRRDLVAIMQLEKGGSGRAYFFPTAALYIYSQAGEGGGVGEEGEFLPYIACKSLMALLTIGNEESIKAIASCLKTAQE